MTQVSTVQYVLEQIVLNITALKFWW